MIPKQLVVPLCFLGLAIFSIGVAAGGYIMLKTGDWTTAALDKYQRSDNHPRWPIPCVWLCLPFGIFIVFGAILAS